MLFFEPHCSFVDTETKKLWTRVSKYLLSLDMRTDEEYGLHDNYSGTHVYAHDLSTVNLALKTKQMSH